MNEAMRHLIGGAVDATVLGAIFLMLGTRRAMWAGTALLLVAGINYIIFATRAGQLDALPLEIVGFIIVAAFAYVGTRRRSPAVIALGWVLHPLWDVAFHTNGLGTYTPDGYAIACISFDIVLAAAIMVVATRRPLQPAEA